MVQTLDQSKNIELTEDDLDTDSKGQLIKLAGQLRDRRNELNQMASERAGKRDELNAQTREAVDKAQEHREQRDSLNEQVQEHKKLRNDLNAQANELFEKVESMKSDLELDQGKGLEELKKEIEQLEFKQQTEVLSTEDERELIEKIEGKREEYLSRKEKLDDNDNLEELVAEAEEVRAEASQHHQEVTELADKAQQHHNEMIEAYREADDIRDKADDMHEKFVEAQEAADQHHNDFVRVQKRLREMDKAEEKERRSAREEKREEAKAEAEEIYQRFKDGETLDTEDLMKLQKTGML
ncbi:phosphoserine phosphatase [Haladaptatus sp. DJG-WS-42]|uniref:coiled-coil protein n=1 Tax=Haladaptatus sp. DJG-WS-42 TaxID=3120516 RepID=UPI0030CE7F9E